MQELIYGLHAALAFMENSPDEIESVLIQANVGTNARLRRLEQRAKQMGVDVTRLPRKQLDEIAGTSRHQGVVIRCGVPKIQDEGALKTLLERVDNALLLILDGVQDPHNLGACMRTAEAAGAHAVIVPKDKAVGLTATVRKTACGAAERLPFFQVTNLARTIEMLQDAGVWIAGATGDAEQGLYDLDMTGPMAIVIGGEGRGLRNLTREYCDYLVSIPMNKSAESLNASVAAAICLYEARRQRHHVKSPLPV